MVSERRTVARQPPDGGHRLARFGGRAWNRFTADGREEPIVDQTEDEIAGYADFRQSLGRLTVDAGVRIDHHTRTGTEWVPQAGISRGPHATER